MRASVAVGVIACSLAGCGASGPGSDPGVTGDEIRLVPGDDVYVTGDQTAGMLANLHRVTAASADVIHLQFKQAGSTFTLDVENFFASTIAYHAEISISGSQPKHTSTCPVSGSGFSGTELWNDPLTALIFHDVAIRATNDFRCVYY